MCRMCWQVSCLENPKLPRPYVWPNVSNVRYCSHVLNRWWAKWDAEANSNCPKHTGKKVLLNSWNLRCFRRYHTTRTKKKEEPTGPAFHWQSFEKTILGVDDPENNCVSRTTKSQNSSTKNLMLRKDALPAVERKRKKTKMRRGRVRNTVAQLARAHWRFWPKPQKLCPRFPIPILQGRHYSSTRVWTWVIRQPGIRGVKASCSFEQFRC